MESRIGRAFTDNLYLVESLPPENEEDYTREYSVMGSTGNVYKVVIENEPTCTCPDFRIRRNRCKHIFFILIRVMKVDNETQDFYDDEELKEMFSNIPRITHNLIANKKLRKKYQKIKKGDLSEDEDEDEKEDFVEQKPIEPDDDCPICLDKLKNGDVDYCKKSCGRSIHKLCFKMWCKKNQPICVFCRAEWSFSQLKNSKRKSRSKSKSKSTSKSRSHSRSRSRSKKQKKKGYINLLYNI